tara:strand:+ start:240 stop:1325 length:1086 start_codon:yes stop_codon:yes gene_type:complete
MAQFYKTVENPNGYTFVPTVSTLDEKMSSPLQGSNLKFTYADRTNNSREQANLFSSFRLPINNTQQTNFDNTYSTTSVGYLNQDVIILAEIPKDEYGELVDGKTIKFEFPTTGGTVDIYGTYFDGATGVGDVLYSDSYTKLGTGLAPIGSLPVDPVSGIQVNPPAGSNDPYKSNVCLLFADSVSTPLAGGSWATGWSTNAPYTNGSKVYYDASGTTVGTYDEPVGIAYLDSGFMVITNTGLTSTFDVSGTVNADGTPYAGGNTNFADIYYSGNTAKLYYESINSEYSLNVLCVAGVNEFTDSTNLTFTVGVDDPRITEIALYGENTTDPTKPGELLAYGKLDRPVEKGAGDVVSFLVQIKA